MRARVKICCISSIGEARTAIELGASALGFVDPMPSGPGVIEDRLIREIAGKVPPPIGTFLLTSETSAAENIRHHQRTHTNTIQIVESIYIPVFLAGGLNPGNARQAIDEVRPFGIDLCSGVRTDGKLDRKKIEEFFKAID